jgi:hypothetical protein
MRKEFKKALRFLIEEYQLIEFQSSDIKRIGSETLIWLTKIEDNRQICIVFSENTKGDSFDVLLGWAKSRIMPKINISGVDAFDLKGPALEKEEHLLSVKLIGESHGTDWEIIPPALSIEQIVAGLEPITDDEALNMVSPIFKNAVEAIHTHAVPFLQRMNERRQINPNAI